MFGRGDWLSKGKMRNVKWLMFFFIKSSIFFKFDEVIFFRNWYESSLNIVSLIMIFLKGNGLFGDLYDCFVDCRELM